MFKTMIILKAIAFENSFNGILNFLGNTALLKGCISEELYQRNVSKRIISIMNFIASLLFNLAEKTIYSVLFFILPYMLMDKYIFEGDYNRESAIMYFFSIISMLCGSLINTSLFSESSEEYSLVNVMRVNATKLCRSKILYKLMTDILFWPLILNVFGINGESIIRLVILLVFARCIGEAVRLIIFDYFEVIYENLLIYDSLFIIGCMALAYVLPGIQKSVSDMEVVINDKVLFTVMSVLGLAGMVYIWFYNNYERFTRRKIARTDVNVKAIEGETDKNANQKKKSEKAVETTETSASEEQMLEEKTKVLDEGIYEKKAGYAYLNALMFSRCRGKMLSHILLQMVVLIIVTLIICGVAALDNPVSIIAKSIIVHKTTLIYAICCLFGTSFGINRSIYYNCDRHMLEFTYYRKLETVVNNYKTRMIRIAVLDMITAIFTVGCIALTMYISDGSIDVNMLCLLGVEIILVTLLFSVYGTMMYHVFQPYNRNLKVSVALFNTIRILVALFTIVLCFFNINVYVMIVVSAVLVITMIVMAEKAVKKYALKNYYNK